MNDEILRLIEREHRAEEATKAVTFPSRTGLLIGLQTTIALGEKRTRRLGTLPRVSLFSLQIFVGNYLTLIFRERTIADECKKDAISYDSQ